jgi:hypothetical protein
MRRRLIAFTTTFALVASAAGAFFAVEVVFGGSHTAPLASGPEPIAGTMSVGFGEGLAPGASEPITLEPENTTGHIIVGHLLEIEPVKTSAGGCSPSWFAVEATNASAKALLAGTGEVTIAPGKAALPEATFKLSFKEEPTNQSGCEKAGLTIAFKLHAS